MTTEKVQYDQKTANLLTFNNSFFQFIYNKHHCLAGVEIYTETIKECPLKMKTHFEQVLTA